jgi:hypothetical protein
MIFFMDTDAINIVHIGFILPLNVSSSCGLYKSKTFKER